MVLSAPHMHAYILRTDREISPFGRRAPRMKIHNRTLADTQSRVLTKLGCTVEHVESVDQIRQSPCLLVRDNLYFTHHALRGFLKQTKRVARGGTAVAGNARGNWRAALNLSLLTERFVSGLQGERVGTDDKNSFRAYDCFYLNDWDRRQPIEPQCELLPIPQRIVKMSSRVNRMFEPTGRFVVPVSRVYMTPVLHWANLVAANLLGMPSYMLRCAAERMFTTMTLPARMLLRALSPRPTNLLGKLYLAERGCRIHPSAHVEGVILGRRVRIGPNAVVKNSVIGPRSQIGAGAVVEGCTLGSEVNVDPNTVTRCCVVDDGANLGAAVVQLSVFGRGAVMCPASGIADFAMRGSVSLTLDGKSVSSGSRLLGGCLGDGAFIGPQLAMVCGRELPNGCILLPHPETVIRDVNKKLPRDVARVDSGRAALRKKPAATDREAA